MAKNGAHAMFGHNAAIFGPIGQKIYMGTQQTIIYRLVMKNPGYDAYIEFLISIDFLY